MVTDLPTQQEALRTYFEPRLDVLPERRPMRDDDPFLSGLTVAEFFALPEDEQARLWSQAHAEAERELGDREQPVQANTLPAQ